MEDTIWYDGGWKDGKRNGEGVDYDVERTGGTYKGTFTNDKFNGQGTFITANGDEHTGEWVFNRLNGK